MKSRGQFEILAVLVLLVAALSGIFMWQLTATDKAQQAQNDLFAQTILTHQADIAQAQIEIAALLAANNAVAEELKSEAAKRLTAEQASKDAQNKLTQLEQTIEKNTLPKTSDIIKQWRPRIAAVYCEWPIKNGSQPTKSGTGVLLSDSSRTTPSVVTSKHLLQNAGALPESCSLDFPDQSSDIDIPPSALTISTGKYDWARMAIATPPAYVTSLFLTPAPRCTSEPAVGDGVVILGYPKIGTKSDITATEGIISGTDGKYYITSAKVERGNSGGAAILIKENCYLGIPTFVDAGEIESLARILQHQQIDN